MCLGLGFWGWGEHFLYWGFWQWHFVIGVLSQDPNNLQCLGAQQPVFQGSRDKTPLNTACWALEH